MSSTGTPRLPFLTYQHAHILLLSADGHIDDGILVEKVDRLQ